MKMTNITLVLALIGMYTLGMAEGTTTVVDTQIEAIQAAPAEERVELMNQLKQRLMQMTQEQRAEAIAVMQEKMSVNEEMGQQVSVNTRTQTKDMKQEFVGMSKERAMEHAQEMQMQTNEEMQNIQTMTQQQAGSQFMQTVRTPDSRSDTSMNTEMMHSR